MKFSGNCCLCNTPFTADEIDVEWYKRVFPELDVADSYLICYPCMRGIILAGLSVRVRKPIYASRLIRDDTKP
jgi:hypothetical protein